MKIIKSSRKSIPTRLILVLGLLCFITINCGTRPDESTVHEEDVPEEVPLVKVEKLGFGTFYKEIVCNGKIYAKEKAQLSFDVSGTGAKLFVENGAYVKKGDVIATLDGEEAQNNYRKALLDYQKNMTDLENLLIGRGGTISDTFKIPAKTLRGIKNKSGFNIAQFHLEQSKVLMSKDTLRAPFTGRIANLSFSRYEHIAAGAKICTILGQGLLDVQFEVLESDLMYLKQGASLLVSPLAFIGDTVKGKLNYITPQVNEDGLVCLGGIISGSNDKLLDGMNVQVIVQVAMPNQIIVPKSAVVLRYGKDVVFTVENGRAIWNYVTILDESSAKCVVGSGLSKEQQVIVEGSIHLSDEAIVTVIPN